MAELKEKILLELEQNRGKALSGQFLADKFGVSRNAVWKAVNSIKKDGYDILSSTNKGYKISENCDILSKEKLQKLLPEIPITVFSTVDSTNNRAKQILSEGKIKTPFLIAADGQSSGRGRSGREFYSPKGGGVYFSLAFSPKVTLASSVKITSYAAVCTLEAIKNLTSRDVRIKWVNDLYCDNKKIGGILTEAVSDFESGEVSSIITGIGINLREACFPEELREKVGFLECEYPIKNELIAETVKGLLKFKADDDSFIQKCREYSCVLGREITYTENGSVYGGKAVDIDEQGHLIVKSKNGLKTLESGEIHLTEIK